MATVIAGMTTSLDGFVADQNGSARRLYLDIADLQGTAFMNAMIEQTGAVLMGKRTFAMADPDSFVGNYEFQVPIFVLTHQPLVSAPPRQRRAD
jgi:riboflavin biosynthesis pyrimidine reductase